MCYRQAAGGFPNGVLVVLTVVCLTLITGTDNLGRGTAAVTAFRIKEAAGLLEQAKKEGPYLHDDHVRLYEQLGIAYAYLDRKSMALETFDILLALDPGHVVPYTLSPKVTFLFEQARRKSDARAPATLHASWPHGLLVTDPTPITVEVVADPKALITKIVLHVRHKEDPEYRELSFDAPPPGAYHKAVVPPLESSSAPDVLQLYLTAHDAHDNEVLLVGSHEHPREISLGLEPPTPWYAQWWVWTIAGTVVAASTGAVVYALANEPPSKVTGTAEQR
ncbi:hypothetical protein ACFL6C_03680 [Myxococcota bacterium]